MTFYGLFPIYTNINFYHKKKNPWASFYDDFYNQNQNNIFYKQNQKKNDAINKKRRK